MGMILQESVDTSSFWRWWSLAWFHQYPKILNVAVHKWENSKLKGDFEFHWPNSLILQVGKLRPHGKKTLAQGHTAGEKQLKDSSSGASSQTGVISTELNSLEMGNCKSSL